MIVLLASICLALGLVCVSWTRLSRRAWPPGPLPLPLIGNLLHLDPARPYKSLTQLARKYGPIFGMHLGGVYSVVVSDAAIIREALRSEVFTGRAPLYVTHGIMGGFGLICSEGDLWKDQRRMSIGWLKRLGMVKFGGNRKSLETRILCGVDRCLQMLSERSGDQDPMKALHHTLGNVMNDLVFGVTYEDTDKTWMYLQHLQEEGVRHIGVSGVVNFIPWLRFLPSNRRIIDFLLRGKAKTHRIYDEIIRAAESCLSKRTYHEPDGDTNIVQMFLRERAKRQTSGDEKLLEYCSDEQHRHLLADLFGAGVDTTLTTIRWFLLFVGRNEAVQATIEKEMSDKLGGKPITIEHYDRLPYLRAAIAETQRIRSVVPIGIPHGATHDTNLHGFLIPKGTMLIPLQWAVHMNPENWHDPEQFNPRRFLSETGEFSAPPNFIPFQTGKRMCLGEELAKMLLFGYCGSIVSHFRLSLRCEPSPDRLGSIEGECGITLTPPNYQMTFTTRR